ncbi:MAG: CBASS cGAMP-activated phospholipase [Pseudomonadota bacterium]
MEKILSIDGGGIKGVFPAVFLAELEEDLDGDLWEYFDLITGTSTGGIIALGLSLGLKARDIANLYEKHGPTIFGQGPSCLPPAIKRLTKGARWLAWGPKHPSDPLKAVLENLLQDRRLGHARTRVMIPAFHGKTQRVYIFKTAHADRLTTDFKELAVDVAMSTAAAPTYFEEYHTERDLGLVDGGLWANNPSGIAVVEGIGTLGSKPSKVRVLSVSCLEDVDEIRSRTGAIRFAPQMAGFFMAGQSHGSLGIAHVLTGHVGGSDHRAIYRVTQSVGPNVYKLDDTRTIRDLKSRALAEAREQKPNLAEIFFGEKAERFEPVHKLSEELTYE